MLRSNANLLKRARGGALLLSVIVCGLLSVMAMALMTRATVSNSVTANTRERMQSLFLAQAGISDALEQLKALKGQIVPIDKYWGGEQRYFVETVKLDNVGHYKLTSTGIVFNRTIGTSNIACSRKIEAIVLFKKKTSQGPFPYMFGKDFFKLDSPNVMDSFDSRGIPSLDGKGNPIFDAQGNPTFTPADYDAQSANPSFHTDPKLGGMSANIATNGSITATGGGNLYGIPSYGFTPPGTPPNSANTSGFKLMPNLPPPMLPRVIVLPDVTALTTPPPSLPVSPGIPAIPPNSKAVFRVSSITSGFVIPAGAEVTVYLDGDLKLTGSAIDIGAGAHLTIFQAPGTGTVQIPGTGFNYRTDSTHPYSTANQLTFVGSSSGDQNWSPSSNWWGTVYAPNAPINFSGNGQLQGALTGKSLTMLGGCQFNFDTAAESPAFSQEPAAGVISSRELPADF